MVTRTNGNTQRNERRKHNLAIPNPRGYTRPVLE